MLLIAFSSVAKNKEFDNYRRNSLCLGYIVEGLGSESEVSLVLDALKKYQISSLMIIILDGWLLILLKSNCLEKMKR